MNPLTETSFQDLHSLSYDELFERQVGKAIKLMMEIPAVAEADTLLGGKISEVVKQKAREHFQNIYNADYYDALRKIYDTEERWNLSQVITSRASDTLQASINLQEDLIKEFEKLTKDLT